MRASYQNLNHIRLGAPKDKPAVKAPATKPNKPKAKPGPTLTPTESHRTKKPTLHLNFNRK